MKKAHLSVIGSLLVLVVGLIVSSSTTPEARDSAAEMAELDDRTAPADRPNILFILADDLGWHQLGSYGTSYHETPVLDQMAADGMRFTQAYAAAPVCSPTRGSIMTGKYPARTHLTVNIPTSRNFDRVTVTPDFAKSLPLEEVTVAEVLQAAGYVTGHFGKWHLNKDKDYAPGRPGDPGSQGFDEVLTTHKYKSGPPSPYAGDYQHVRHITDQALAFMETNRDRPFFAYVSHNSIHDPEIEKKSLVAKYRQKSGSGNDVKQGHHNPIQGAMLEVLDASIGRLFERVRELGIEERTLIVFFSDNGHLGTKDGLPLRGSKGDLYEGGIRSPLIVKWPGQIPSGTTSDELVISNDFLPTFASLAGVAGSPENLDGLDLSELFRNPSSRLGRNTLYFHFPHYHRYGLGPQGAIRVGDLKLIESYERNLLGQPDVFELYDLEADPAERRNLAAERPNKVKELATKLAAWRKSVGAQEMTTHETLGNTMHLKERFTELQKKLL